MIVKEGHTCWKRAQAERVAFMIDAESYFRHLVSCLEQAQRSILIVGWDIHSQTPLRRGDEVDEDRYRLGSLLNRLARGNRHLRIHLLMWDFSMIFAAEREVLQRFRLGWKSHRRVHFELDNSHPLGASHHQKIVVVDDEVAFIGGLDLTMRRWDTPEHAPQHPQRRDPDGKPYRPFHDVQAAVSGPAARVLGDLVRERWRRATGRRVRPVEGVKGLWPEELEAELEDLAVGICRTEPAHDGRPEVREIERLYEEALTAADRHVLLENQYATSGKIGAALQELLRRDQGPEILLIQPHSISGFLQNATIGTLRAQFLESVIAADSHGRFLSCYPARSDLEPDSIKVHSKVCIVDDFFLTLGSANLANRSMGLDTECNVAIEVNNARDRRAIRRFRDRLLGEHLGADPDRVAETLKRTGSLLETVRALGSDERSLQPLGPAEPAAAWVRDIVPDDELLDPERPLGVVRLREAPRSAFSGGWYSLIGLLAAAVLLAFAWRYGPLADWLQAKQLESWIEGYRQSEAALPLTVGLFVVGGVIFFPVTLLILQTAAVFGPFAAFFYALAGSLASAVLMFWLGRLLGGRNLRRLAGRRFSSVARFLASRGTLSMAAIRLVPVAPFSMVNMGAGAVGIRWLPFLAGTLLGMAPGIAALTLFGDRAGAAIREPGWRSILLLLGTAALLFGLGRLVGTKTLEIIDNREDE